MLSKVRLKENWSSWTSLCGWVVSKIHLPTLITGRNEVLAKVIFLHLSFCSQGGFWQGDPPGMENPPGPDTPPSMETPLGPDRPRDQTPPRHGDPHRTWPPRDQTPPPGSRLRHTVYDRPVCILLECILVLTCLWTSANESPATVFLKPVILSSPNLQLEIIKT